MPTDVNRYLDDWTTDTTLPEEKYRNTLLRRTPTSSVAAAITNPAIKTPQTQAKEEAIEAKSLEALKQNIYSVCKEISKQERLPGNAIICTFKGETPTIQMFGIYNGDDAYRDGYFAVKRTENQTMNKAYELLLSQLKNEKVWLNEVRLTLDAVYDLHPLKKDLKVELKTSQENKNLVRAVVRESSKRKAIYEAHEARENKYEALKDLYSQVRAEWIQAREAGEIRGRPLYRY